MKIELGELRNQFSLDMQRKVLQIIDDHKNKPFYYLLIHNRYDPVLSKQMGVKAIRTTFMISYDLPLTKMLGTFCYQINNRLGKIERLWALPLDAPKDEKLLTNDGVKEVFDSAKGMPIIH